MSFCKTTRPLCIGALMCAPVAIALGCVSEGEAPREVADDPGAQVAPPVAEVAQPSQPESDTAVPAPTCASFADAARGRVTYVAEHISRNGPRTHGGDFIFLMEGNMLRGEVQLENGGVVRSHALQSIYHDVTSDSIFFWYDVGGGVRQLYRLHGSCDDLRGTARLFVTEDNTQGTVVDVVLTPVAE